MQEEDHRTRIGVLTAADNVSRCGVKIDKLSFDFLNTFVLRALVPWVGWSSCAQDGTSQLALCANCRDRRGSKPRMETEACSSSTDSVRAFVPSVDVTAAFNDLAFDARGGRQGNSSKNDLSPGAPGAFSAGP